MILDPVFWRINNFLSEEEVEKLFEFVESNKENFVPTQTWSNEPNYRSSKTIYSSLIPKEMYDSWNRRLHSLLPQICINLLHPEFEPSEENFEFNLTAHNDGDFYKVHADVGSALYNKREITYIYYFSKPNSFTNGLRQLYPTDITNITTVWPKNIPEEGSVYFKPVHNSIVFFDPRLMHQVLPISCPSKEFMDSNFTINGWIHRKDL